MLSLCLQTNSCRAQIVGQLVKWNRKKASKLFHLIYFIHLLDMNIFVSSVAAIPVREIQLCVCVWCVCVCVCVCV